MSRLEATACARFLLPGNFCVDKTLRFQESDLIVCQTLTIALDSRIKKRVERTANPSYVEQAAQFKRGEAHRQVFVYTDIDAEQMENRFWQVYRKYKGI